mmetsp:Transcript_14176/g.30765  ORF Transcript_14176/g.30765 Transcript_14176/m.30765 type:complete len:327 (-) Transcript_14176:1073-2053(-)
MDAPAAASVADQDSPPADKTKTDEDEVSIVKCDTSSGPIAMKLVKSWSPLGYQRATELFRRGYYDNSHFYRVVPDFLVQFGIGYTQSDSLWRLANDEHLLDDPQLVPPIPFEEGTIAFAGSGENTRTSELFIAFEKQKHKFGKTKPWETPIGVVTDGMDVIKNLYSDYGDVKPSGNGPDQFKIENVGRSYIEENFPLLDHFKRCTVEREGGSSTNSEKQDKQEVKDDIIGGRATAEIRKLASSLTLKEGVVLDDGIFLHSDTDTHTDHMRHKISAYRDHHDNVQSTEGTGWSTLVAFVLMAILVWTSFAIPRGFGRKRRGRRSKAL